MAQPVSLGVIVDHAWLQLRGSRPQCALDSFDVGDAAPRARLRHNCALYCLRDQEVIL